MNQCDRNQTCVIAPTSTSPSILQEAPPGDAPPPAPRPAEEPVRRSPSRSSLGSRHSLPSHDRLHGSDRPRPEYDSDADKGRMAPSWGRQRDWDLERPHPDGVPPMGSERGRRGHSRERPGWEERGREERGREDRDREMGHWQHGR